MTVNSNGCWVSTYSIGSHGYAQVAYGESGKRFVVLAHRVSWSHHNGAEIPDGMTVDHMCKNRRCVNPTHLRLLSHYDNSRRGGHDWPLGECKYGHPDKHLKPVNGGRQVSCVVCCKRWSTDSRIRNRDSRLEKIACETCGRRVARNNMARHRRSDICSAPR